MSDELDILSASAECLFADHVTPQLLERVDAGEWPETLWCAVEAAGFEQAEMPELGVLISQITGRFAAPIPLAETILARALLEDAALHVPPGALTIAVQDNVSIAADGACPVLPGVFPGRAISGISWWPAAMPWR